MRKLLATLFGMSLMMGVGGMNCKKRQPFFTFSRGAPAKTAAERDSAVGPRFALEICALVCGIRARFGASHSLIYPLF
jgi:hypothetical protein